MKMQLRNIALCLLLVPVAHRMLAVQKNNVSIKVKVCSDIEWDSVNKQTLNIEKAFTAKGLVPVWVKITNTSNTALQIMNESTNITQKNMDAFINYYKYSPIRQSGSIYLMLATLSNVFLFHDFSWHYHATAATATINKVPQWKNLSFIKRVSSFSKTQSYVNRFIGLNTFLGLAAVGFWLIVRNDNKNIEAFLNKLMLEEQLIIDPGQTVKKLVVVGAEKKFTLDVIDPSTNQAIQKFEYKWITAKNKCVLDVHDLATTTLLTATEYE